MPLVVTLDALIESLEGKTRRGGLIEVVDSLAGLAIVCAPIALGPQGLAALPLLVAKNELTKLGQRLLEAVAGRRPDDPQARLEMLQTAHVCLVYTAFFAALDELLPDVLRAKLDPLLRSGAKDDDDAPRRAHPIELPHPTQSLERQIERHMRLWKALSEGLASRFGQFGLNPDRQESDSDRALVRQLGKVPERAAELFPAHYFGLARACPEFAVWTDLSEHDATRAQLDELGEQVARLHTSTAEGQSALDIGMTRLGDAMDALPQRVADAIAGCQAKAIIDGMRDHAARRLDDLVLDVREMGDPDEEVSFPRTAEAFVPQAYRVLRKARSRSGPGLEDERTWDAVPRRDDLGAFLYRYLQSPYSVHGPLLVLGHPGSGKSLLTKVLAAHLARRGRFVVRVPLRHVDPDVSMLNQIQQAMALVIDEENDTWARASALFAEHPPVVILDGYDELLQATGKVYGAFLDKVAEFQANQRERGRPVRMIVTSRLTLIDKAVVSVGSTVLRLLPFDEPRRQRWIEIWNRVNRGYFDATGVAPFALPESDAEGAGRILDLSEQPLLLLLLALYDSGDNALARSEGLDRTRLYDRLLRQFVKRELLKTDEWQGSRDDPAALAEPIDDEMQRLGIVALGMYNRRQVHIASGQLADDLRFFDHVAAEGPGSGRRGQQLSPSEVLLGSFFFIHCSLGEESVSARRLPAAYEFLHNTFGEFLAADFIAGCVIDELAERVERRSKRSRRRGRGGRQAMGRQWYASLIYTPLFTRPVVLAMLREWSAHRLADEGLDGGDFAAELDDIVMEHLHMLLSHGEMPALMRQETVEERYTAQFGRHPLLGHMAIYGVNLLLLRAAFAEAPFVFDEGRIEQHEDGRPPWERLLFLWRSWFSQAQLGALAGCVRCERGEGGVEVGLRGEFVKPGENQHWVQTEFEICDALADGQGAVLAGLVRAEMQPRDFGPVTQEIRASDGLIRYLWLRRELTRMLSSSDEHGPAAFAEGLIRAGVEATNAAFRYRRPSGEAAAIAADVHRWVEANHHQVPTLRVGSYVAEWYLHRLIGRLRVGGLGPVAQSWGRAVLLVSAIDPDYVMQIVDWIRDRGFWTPEYVSVRPTDFTAVMLTVVDFREHIGPDPGAARRVAQLVLPPLGDLSRASSVCGSRLIDRLLGADLLREAADLQIKVGPLWEPRVIIGLARRQRWSLIRLLQWSSTSPDGLAFVKWSLGPGPWNDGAIERLRAIDVDAAEKMEQLLEWVAIESA